jgi:hypothetical protein
VRRGSDPATHVTRQRLDLFERYRIRAAIARESRERLQVEHRVRGYDRKADPVLVVPDDQRLEHLLRRQADLLRDDRCRHMIGGDLVFTELVRNAEPVEQAGSVRLHGWSVLPRNVRRPGAS